MIEANSGLIGHAIGSMGWVSIRIAQAIRSTGPMLVLMLSPRPSSLATTSRGLSEYAPLICLGEEMHNIMLCFTFFSQFITLMKIINS